MTCDKLEHVACLHYKDKLNKQCRCIAILYVCTRFEAKAQPLSTSMDMKSTAHVCKSSTWPAISILIN